LEILVDGMVALLSNGVEADELADAFGVRFQRLEL